MGGIVGGAALLGGGQGNVSGAVCAVLAVLAIFAGKWFAFDSIAHAEVRDEFGIFLTHDVYTEAMDNAATYSRLAPGADVRQFMIDRNFTEAGWPDAVNPVEITMFHQMTVPQLRWIQSEQPSYSEWKDESIDTIVDTFIGQISKTDMIEESLGLMDVLFGVLGIVTAFRLGSQARPGIAA